MPTTKTTKATRATRSEKRGRPTRFPGKSSRDRLTVALTNGCRKRITHLSVKLGCSQSDVVEMAIWQLITKE